MDGILQYMQYAARFIVHLPSDVDQHICTDVVAGRLSPGHAPPTVGARVDAVKANASDIRLEVTTA